jgi:predicted nucleic acid-binding protein
MTGTAFVDTNILVYSRDASESKKQPVALEWMEHLWTERTGRISTQVLNEFYVMVTQKLKPGLDRRSARDEIRTLFSWRPSVLDRDVIEGGWRVQDLYGLSFWDGLIVSSALIAGCRYLLSEDLQDGQAIEGLQVVNPFTRKPDDLD